MACFTEAAEQVRVAPLMTSLSADWASTMEAAHSWRRASFMRSLSPEEVMAQSVILSFWMVASTRTVLKLLVLSAA